MTGYCLEVAISNIHTWKKLSKNFLIFQSNIELTDNNTENAIAEP